MKESEKTVKTNNKASEVSLWYINCKHNFHTYLIRCKFGDPRVCLWTCHPTLNCYLQDFLKKLVLGPCQTSMMEILDSLKGATEIIKICEAFHLIIWVHLIPLWRFASIEVFRRPPVTGKAINFLIILFKYVYSGI